MVSLTGAVCTGAVTDVAEEGGGEFGVARIGVVRELQRVGGVGGAHISMGLEGAVGALGELVEALDGRAAEVDLERGARLPPNGEGCIADVTGTNAVKAIGTTVSDSLGNDGGKQGAKLVFGHDRLIRLVLGAGLTAAAGTALRNSANSHRINIISHPMVLSTVLRKIVCFGGK